MSVNWELGTTMGKGNSLSDVNEKLFRSHKEIRHQGFMNKSRDGREDGCLIPGGEMFDYNSSAFSPLIAIRQHSEESSAINPVRSQ
jgi:hypothetical protein